MFAENLVRRSGQLLKVWANSTQNSSVDTCNENNVAIVETYNFKEAGHRDSRPSSWSGSCDHVFEMNTSNFALPHRTFGPYLLR